MRREKITLKTEHSSHSHSQCNESIAPKIARVRTTHLGKLHMRNQMTMAMSMALILACSFSMAAALPSGMAPAMELRDVLRHTITPITNIRLARNGIQTSNT